jgi:hypothetical protein
MLAIHSIQGVPIINSLHVQDYYTANYTWASKINPTDALIIPMVHWTNKLILNAITLVLLYC